MWTSLLAPELQLLEVEGGREVRGAGHLNVYTTNTTNILLMLHGMERIKQSRLDTLRITGIEQELLHSVTRLILYPKVRSYQEGLRNDMRWCAKLNCFNLPL